MKMYPVSKEQLAGLDHRFSYHAPQGAQAERYDYLRQMFHDMALVIMQTVPAGREKSMALTNLETAGFWANAAIARNQ